MNGPFPAGTNDVSIFVRSGLLEKMRETNKKGIADQGYKSYPKILSTTNNHDSKEAAQFKLQALMRHETFNGYTKTFKCLSGCFCHSAKCFQACFEAVCVIC